MGYLDGSDWWFVFVVDLFGRGWVFVFIVKFDSGDGDVFVVIGGLFILVFVLVCEWSDDCVGVLDVGFYGGVGLIWDVFLVVEKLGDYGLGWIFGSCNVGCVN